jgi:hypothetical protein
VPRWLPLPLASRLVLRRVRRSAGARQPDGFAKDSSVATHEDGRVRSLPIADAQSRLEALAAFLRTQAEVDTRVLFGDARREIAKVAATERAGLVITTLRVRSTTGLEQF